MSERSERVKRTRDLYERLAVLDPSWNACAEAHEQAGLPEVFVWDHLSIEQLHALAVALQIRLMDAVGAA